jgi:beta-glucosidase
LGLFDRPFASNERPVLLSEEHLRVARDLARQSVVLLKNKNRRLPLDRSKVTKLAVIGPMADARKAQLGAWVLDGREADSRTPLAAIRESAGKGMDVSYAPGLVDDLDQSTSRFDEAVATAQKADIVLLFVGEGADLSGEARSRALLDLPGGQNALIDAIVNTGKPIVLIVEAGRPLTIGKQIEKVDSVLYSFHAGTMAGPALSDLIWGIESPSGKLPVTFPKTVGQLPLYYNHTNTGRPPRPYYFPEDSRIGDHISFTLGNNSNYIDVGPYPLYPFGYGLSYTTFEYGRAELSTTTLRAGESLTIRAPVTNTGKIAADEVVQLYVRNVAGSAIHPVRELKAFQRIRLASGEKKMIQFSLSRDSLSFFDAQEKQVLNPGKIVVYVGASSFAPQAGEVEIQN